MVFKARSGPFCAIPAASGVLSVELLLDLSHIKTFCEMCSLGSIALGTTVASGAPSEAEGL